MAETAAQAKQIETVISAANISAKRAKECAADGCFVLAREWEHFSQHMRKVADWQRRALTAAVTENWKQLDAPASAPAEQEPEAKQLDLGG